MKILKYDLLQGVIESGEPILIEKTITWSEANEEIAKKEAYNSEYAIEDDGQPDPADIPTREDELEARLTYMEMMTNMLEV